MSDDQKLSRINTKLAAEGAGNHIERRGSSYVMLNADGKEVYTANDLDVLEHFILGASSDPR